MSSFSVGDTVRVLRNGHQYTAYQKWADEVGASRWIYGVDIPVGFTYIVRAIKPHSVDRADPLALLEATEGGQEYIFGLYNPEGNIDLVSKGDAKVARRTFKLIKDTPTHKKGTLFQEQCDDGTQPYIVLNQDPFINDGFSIKDRKLVEEQPQWFVEVFQAEPQYMTREELDRWKAFRAGQPAKTRKRLVADAQAQPVVIKRATKHSDERIAHFVKVHNSSRSCKSVADKMKISLSSVYLYKAEAKRRGHTLKTMKRAKVAPKAA